MLRAPTPDRCRSVPHVREDRVDPVAPGGGRVVPVVRVVAVVPVVRVDRADVVPAVPVVVSGDVVPVVKVVPVVRAAPEVQVDPVVPEAGAVDSVEPVVAATRPVRSASLAVVPHVAASPSARSVRNSTIWKRPHSVVFGCHVGPAKLFGCRVERR